MAANCTIAPACFRLPFTPRALMVGERTAHVTPPLRYEMTDSIKSDSQSMPPFAGDAQPAEQAKQRGKRGGSRRGTRNQDSSDFQRQHRQRIDLAMSGYGDGIERAICLGVPSRPPRSFPVQHRTGLAVRALATVARSDNAVLLCDGQHEGPHVWPNGDITGPEGQGTESSIREQSGAQL